MEGKVPSSNLDGVWNFSISPSHLRKKVFTLESFDVVHFNWHPIEL